ncbi:hypothetical protein NA56DRAFT_294747 [Hyaloscypha hepaticicola]|uniref:Uncharacterized protein n=1 Tax=Hyaloscypha hepaticicola TaxID=2082293 RepID=A0A2J6QKD1_9HELO|nr:hypothetical protein NA56DRAFT_294747 [Hyaloscypha hepaticicola]
MIFFPNNADRQGRIFRKLSLEAFPLRIAVDQDAIRTECTTEGTESLLVLDSESDSGSELSDGIPERSSQNLDNVYRVIIFLILFSTSILVTKVLY